MLDTDARQAICGHDCGGQLVRLYVNAVNNNFHGGKNSDVPVTKHSCRLSLLEKYKREYYLVLRASGGMATFNSCLSSPMTL